MGSKKRGREYLRCPCCGRVRRAQAFAPDVHRLEVLWCEYVGGGRGRGFQWSRRPLDAATGRALLKVLSMAEERVRAAMAEPAAFDFQIEAESKVRAFAFEVEVAARDLTLASRKKAARAPAPVQFAVEVPQLRALDFDVEV